VYHTLFVLFTPWILHLRVLYTTVSLHMKITADTNWICLYTCGYFRVTLKFSYQNQLCNCDAAIYYTV